MLESDLERLSRLVLDEFKRVHNPSTPLILTFPICEVRTIRKQLDELEHASKNFAGFAKEIDHLLGRVAAIEKHLGLQNNITA